MTTEPRQLQNEDHPKWLQIDPMGAGYSVVDLSNTANFTAQVAPSGLRIPILPLVVAMYHDALQGFVTGARTKGDLSDFASDFNFSVTEMLTYFDDSQYNPHNQRLLQAFPQNSYMPISSIHTGGPSGSATTTPNAPISPAPIPIPVLIPTLTSAPATNTGWDAERFVQKTLEANGWSVYDVSRQRLGYDLIAKVGTGTRYVDVKSSLGYCSPTLTSREWQQAKALGTRYVLAIVENFDPNGINAIFWVPDPVGTCAPTLSQTVQYAVARSSWQTVTVPIGNI